MSSNSESNDADEIRPLLQDLTPPGDWSVGERSLVPAAEALIQTGQARLKSVQCFDYVPSNFYNAWQCLSRLASLCGPSSTHDDWLKGTLWREHVSKLSSPAEVRFCEWGSGLGIAAGLADLAGFESTGIEIDARLAEQSRQLQAEFHLKTNIMCGSYYDIDQPADMFYVYAWPGQRPDVIERFSTFAPAHALLLICDGQDLLRVMARWPEA